ncbi:hypothetical protein ACH4OW_23165 [Streptomyces sp. NPDC017056]|uniref:hypothetical protein n=1 Tax=Streptomyces sp. NPDC017056 TaxID=3364973 RepID=UPI0037993BDE
MPSHDPTPSAPPLTTEDITRLALRAGLPLPANRLPGVTATVNAVDTVLGTLRRLPLGDTFPATAFTPTPATAPRTAP